MKKALTLLLALLLACSVIFTGCGKSNSPDDTDTDTQPNVSQSDGSNDDEQAAPFEPLVFTLLPDDTYAVTGLKTAIAHEIVIPSTYNGKSVTRIGDYAFAYCGYYNEVTTVVIPDSVTSIGTQAFYECIDLVSVTIGSSVESIGYEAFQTDGNIVEVVNNSKLDITIGSEDNGAVAQYSLDVHDGASKLDNVDGYLFYTCDNVNYLVKYIGSDKILTLPKNYNGEDYEIYENAFYAAAEAFSITIPEGVTKIHEYAFDGCVCLAEVINNSSLEITAGSTDNGNVGRYAKNVRTGGASDVVEQNGFWFYTYDGVNYLLGATEVGTFLVLPDSYNGNTYELYGGAFALSTQLVSVTLSSGVTGIGYGAFEECPKIAEVVNNSSLDNDKLDFWSALEIHDGTTKIDNRDGYLFYTYGEDNYLVGYTGSDVSLELPESYNGEAYKIHGRAFAVCNELTDVVIPDGVSDIGKYTFAQCRGLKSVVIGNGIVDIGGVFQCCTSLASINIPDSVQSIDSTAFEYCTFLSIYTGSIEGLCNAASGLDSCYYDLYVNDSLVTELTVSETSDTEYGALAACKSIKAVYVHSIEKLFETSLELPEYKLYINDALVTELVIPQGAVNSKKLKLAGCTSLTSVSIPKGITTIARGAFKACTSLTSVTFKSTNGWSCRSRRYEGEEGLSLSSDELANKTTAASYLTKEYCKLYWRRINK